jgi:hypothetical protein
MAEIYALYSTRDGRVRYVGRSGDCALRFKDHLRSAERSKENPLLDTWFHQEWGDRYLVRYALLDVCDYDKRGDVEKKWIWRFPGADLLNQRNRFSWWNPKPPVIPEIVKYMRSPISNVDGFRGVHYDCDTGYYRVLVYNRRWVKWLEGDELPGGSAPIWFSDLARAVNARDKIHRAPRGPADWHRRKLPLIRISLLMKGRCQEDIIASGAWEEARYRKEGYVW